MTAAMNLIEKQAQAHGREEVVGAIVWCDANVGERLYERARVRDALLNAGLDPEIQSADLSPQAAFGHALHRATLPDGWKIERDEKRGRRALLFRKSGKGAARVDHAQVLLSANSTTAVIECDPPRWTLAPETEAALTTIEVEYDQLRRFITSSELQATVRRAVTKWFCGTRIRPQSGTFYIDVRHIEAVRRFRAVIEALGGTRLVVFPLFSGAAEELRGDLRDGFEAERMELLQKLHALTTSAEDRSVRASTYEARIEELALVRQRVVVARAVLKDYADDLLNGLAVAESAARDCLAQRTVDWSSVLEGL